MVNCKSFQDVASGILRCACLWTQHVLNLGAWTAALKATMLSDCGSTLSTNEVLRIDWMISVYAHRWILLIHIHHAVESGKAHDVMVKWMQEMLAVWLALRKACQVDFVEMFLAGNCHCLAAPVTAFSRFSGVCLMILAAKWWIASLFKMLHLAFYGVRAFERSMYSTLVPEQHSILNTNDLHWGWIWQRGSYMTWNTLLL